MKIYSNAPTDWKDLQNKVAQLLTESGYTCEIEKDVQTVRGTINIDIFAVSKQDNPQNIFFCECKQWDTPVPKSMIHSFRTVVTDFGANHGLIISKSGFQSGAYDAAQNTNILLLNWEELENLFWKKWVSRKQPEISKQTKHLRDYVIGSFTLEKLQLTKPEQKRFDELFKEYLSCVIFCANQGFINAATGEFNTDSFEKGITEAEDDFGIKYSSYEDYYNYLVEKAQEGIQAFDDLFKKPLRESEEKIKFTKR